jgi:hypothetical protein
LANVQREQAHGFLKHYWFGDQAANGHFRKFWNE